MSRCLHLTNGDEAAARIEALVAPEPVLPWRDILYDGPVPGGLTLEALSAERARHLAARFRLDPERVQETFRDRDRRVREAMPQADRLVLWFEHDLCDQLQLLQLLDLVGREEIPAAHVRLAQADTYLTGLTPVALGELGARAAEASPAQMALAREAWAAFRAPTPEELACLLGKESLDALPWLRPALTRLLEELPTDYPGLSTTERYILEELGAGPVAAGELYARCRARERAWFMGDWSFFAVLDELAATPLALVAGPPVGGFPFEGGRSTREAYLGAEVRITHEGQLVREGRLDRAIAKPLDRWLGGTHLTSSNLWRWEPATATLQHVCDAGPA
jgi:hypothetical protein